MAVSGVCLAFGACTFMYICMWAVVGLFWCVNVGVCECMHKCMTKRAHTHTHTCVCVYIYIYIYIYTHIHACRHTYIHTYVQRNELKRKYGVCAAKEQQSVGVQNRRNGIPSLVGMHVCMHACMYVCMYVQLKNSSLLVFKTEEMGFHHLLVCMHVYVCM
jgi:hypothetical protein